MLVSRGRNPNAAEVISQLIGNPGLRNRVLTTLGLLLLVRFGIYIPIPGIDRTAFASFIEQGGSLLGFLDIYGGGISTLGVFGNPPLHQRINHSPKPRRVPFPSWRICRRTKERRTTQNRPDHPAVSLGWGLIQR